MKILNSLLFRLAGKLILDDPSFYSSLAARYQRSSLFWREGLNQACRWLRLPLAFSLTTIGIETNNTCNLVCQHCPGPTEMTRPRGLMLGETFRQIIAANPGIARIYLTDWGEPLLHPEIVEMVAYAHSHGKHVALTTNATLLDHRMSQELLKAGLDPLKVSIDGGPKTYEKIRGYPYEQVRENLFGFLRLRKEKDAKTWVEVAMVVYEETIDEIESFLTEWQNRVDAVNFQPRFFSLPRKRQRTCRDLWRLLVILWDGRLSPCCVDYDGQIILGQLSDGPLQAVFNGQAMRSLRQKHIKKQWPDLCSRCLAYEADYHLSLKRINEIKRVKR